ncbi:MAG: AI-2E family transporter [Deltaproteobacteria bacterium]|nr:AI-2E family transporter [Deltaproteobacteria bacterium]
MEPPLDLPPSRRYGNAALILTLVLAFALFVVTLSSTLPPVLLGGLLAAFAAPLRSRIERRFRGRRVAAATITVAIVLAVLLPASSLAILLVRRVIEIAAEAPAIVRALEPGGAVEELLADKPFIRQLLPDDLGAEIARAVTWVARALPGVVVGFVRGLLFLFLTILTTYFLLRDGPWMLARLEHALPLEPRHTRAIVREFQLVARGVIFGTLGTAVAQGIVAGLGYWALGLREPLLLGALTCVTALVPVLGSGLVWIPLSTWLFATGNVSRGLLLLAFGILVVGTLDNVLRPLLAREGLQVHPLLVFLGLFGGLAAFGPSGIYLGPLLVSLFVALARIYEREIAPAAIADGSDTRQT